MKSQDAGGAAPQRKKAHKTWYRDLPPAWRCGLGVFLVVAFVAGCTQVAAYMRGEPWYMVLLVLAALLVLCAVIAALLLMLYALLRRVPVAAVAVFGFGVLLLVLAAPLVLLAVGGFLSGYFIWQWVHGAYKGKQLRQRVAAGVALGLSVALLVGWAGVLFWPVTAAQPLPGLAASEVSAGLADPSQPGGYAYETFYYATPQQKLNPYPGKDSLPTGTVDASYMLAGWSGLRSWRYGFDPEALPLNAQVWMPQGAGPFPLVLIVHGNHNAADRSDGGYAYLGELLASHGIIAASVDENFLNSSIFCDLLLAAPLQEENDARAYVLMEHLRAWAGWTADPGHVFYGKADMGNVGLIGHSRGGEAAAVAAAFSQLGFYPDNGALRFETPYTIRAVAALAPVDKQYQPADRALDVAGVNYLVLHGTHDMDVQSFMGAETYRRVTPDEDGFKACVYIQHANHGQFNASWGVRDTTGAHNLIYKENQLLTMTQQQQAAKVFIGAFMRASLQGEGGYEALFKDLRQGWQWLPATQYAADYANGRMVLLAGFEEDIDLATAAAEGVQLAAANFDTWREGLLPTKWGGTNHVLTLGWYDDDKRQADIPVFTINLAGAQTPLECGDALWLSMAAASREHPTLFTLRLTDAGGRVSEQPIAAFGGVGQPLEGEIYRFPFSMGKTQAEPVLQGVRVDTALFAGLAGEIVQVELVMEAEGAQTLYVDDIRIEKCA